MQQSGQTDTTNPNTILAHCIEKKTHSQFTNNHNFQAELINYSMAKVKQEFKEFNSNSSPGSPQQNTSVVQQSNSVKRKRSVNPQSDENFMKAMEAVRFGGIGFCKAARMYGVNNRTLWLEFKKRGYPNNRSSIKARAKDKAQSESEDSPKLQPNDLSTSSQQQITSEGESDQSPSQQQQQQSSQQQQQQGNSNQQQQQQNNGASIGVAQIQINTQSTQTPIHTSQVTQTVQFQQPVIINSSPLGGVLSGFVDGSRIEFMPLSLIPQRPTLLTPQQQLNFHGMHFNTT